MDESEEVRATSGRRVKSSAIVPLTGLLIMLGGSLAAVLGAGEPGWVVAILGFFVVLIAFGF